MKAIRNKSKLAVIFLVLLILNQSCRVYHKESSTLEIAVKEQPRVKIITNNNEKYKFKKILLIDGAFYGIKMKNGKQNRIPLKIEELKEVKLHDKSTSLIFSVLVSAGAVGLIYLVSLGLSPLGSGTIDLSFE